MERTKGPQLYEKSQQIQISACKSEFGFKTPIIFHHFQEYRPLRTPLNNVKKVVDTALYYKLHKSYCKCQVFLSMVA